MPASDRVLRPYLECPDERPADDLLTRLLFDQAEPLVRGVLERRLRSTAGIRDREDIVAEVLLELLVRLRKIRTAGGDPPPENFRAYVVKTAHHACDEYFRWRYPQRQLLKNRVRYVLRETPQFAIWTDANGATACGWARWKGRTVVEFTGCHVLMRPNEAMESALGAIFEDGGGPVELDDVAGFLAAAWGLGKLQAPVEAVDWRAAAAADPAAVEDHQRRLERLWAAVLLLPLAQRQALLLHLRDDRGGAALTLFPASGVARIPQIADALAMPVQEVAELWSRLPLDDAEIAAYLKLTRQEVIDLRNAGRKGLARSGY